MKYEIPGCEGLTIKNYKKSFFGKKLKVRYVKIKKPIFIPYSKEAETRLLNVLENQLDEYVNKTTLSATKDNCKYNLYHNHRSEFKVSNIEKSLFDIKDMDVNANNIDSFTYDKLRKRLKELRNYREALQHMKDNGIYLEQKKVLKKSRVEKNAMHSYI